MRTHRYVVCDVFTDMPLTGNALAVFPHGDAIPESLLQPIAREMNLSETVFAYPPASGGHARIRIFTPARELPFAGHPVLGSAVVLGSAAELAEIRLETGSGTVAVALERRDARVVFGRMSQPIPAIAPYEPARELLAALGVERAALPIEVYDVGPRHIMVGLESEAQVRGLAPRLADVGGLPPGCVYCFAGRGTRWTARSFCPALGIPEDPASGSAAGPLAVHLARHGQIAFGDEIEVSQGTEVGRPSLLFARATGTAAKIERVDVGGSTVIVAEGEIDLSG